MPNEVFAVMHRNPMGFHQGHVDLLGLYYGSDPQWPGIKGELLSHIRTLRGGHEVHAHCRLMKLAFVLSRCPSRPSSFEVEFFDRQGFSMVEE